MSRLRLGAWKQNPPLHAAGHSGEDELTAGPLNPMDTEAGVATGGSSDDDVSSLRAADEVAPSDLRAPAPGSERAATRSGARRPWHPSQGGAPWDVAPASVSERCALLHPGLSPALSLDSECPMCQIELLGGWLDLRVPEERGSNEGQDPTIGNRSGALRPPDAGNAFDH